MVVLEEVACDDLYRDRGCCILEIVPPHPSLIELGKDSSASEYLALYSIGFLSKEILPRHLLRRYVHTYIDGEGSWPDRGDATMIGGETDSVAPCMRSFNPGEI